MKKFALILLVLAVVAGLSWGTTAQAQGTDQVAVRGVILGVNLQHHVLALLTRHGRIHVLFGPDTEVVINGHPARPFELHRGMRAEAVGRRVPDRRAIAARAIRAVTRR